MLYTSKEGENNEFVANTTVTSAGIMMVGPSQGCPSDAQPTFDEQHPDLLLSIGVDQDEALHHMTAAQV